MSTRARRAFGSLCLTALLVAGSVARGHAASGVVPPMLRDVTGATVDVAALATGQRLVFVTLKATWCPVCRAQLQRLGRVLPHLRACGAMFVVLVPGTNHEVAAVARDTSFPYPFVTAGAWAIAEAAGLTMGPDQLVPAFFAVNAAREIVWEQRGRGDGDFGDDELFAYLGCKRPTTPDLLAALPGSAGEIPRGD